MSFELLILSEEAIDACTDPADYLQAADEAFRAVGDGTAEVSPKHHWEFSVGKSAAFASYLSGPGAMAIKLGTIRPANPGRHGLPPGLSQIVVHDADTGRPLALLDGALVTAMRTAAAAALAAKVLGRPESSRVAVFGTGIVAEKSIDALAAVFSIAAVSVVGSHPGRAEEFAGARAHLYPFPLIASDARSAALEADVIVTATTASSPVICDAWIRPGTHISALGADWKGKQELDPATLLRAKLVTDSYLQCLEIGEGNVPFAEGRLKRSDIAAELGEVIVGRVPGRRDPDQVTVFDSSGIAPQDCAAAMKVVDRAAAAGLGTRVML